MAEKSVFKITAKYAGKCKECGDPLDVGDEIVYDTAEKRAYCLDCGEELLA